jgi:hypothetical protein
VLTVNSLDDNTTDTSALTLREAVALVDNAGTPASLGQPSMPAGWAAKIDNTNPFGTNDTIQFDPNLFSGGMQTLSLSQGAFLLNKSVSINGPGRTLLTLDAQQKSQIFVIAKTPTGPARINATVTLDDMTLTNGKSTAANISGDGGAVRSFLSATGSLTINNCTITNNSSAFEGGAIGSFGPLTIENCIISNNSSTDEGGGVFNQGESPTITDSSITDNQASGGGGVYCATVGTLTLTNCQVSGNTATSSGFGGGGIATPGTNLSLLGCTVTGNSAQSDLSGDGGISTDSAFLSVQNSTISGNFTTGQFSPGGGVHFLFGSTASLTVVNSTISGNYTLGDNSSGGGLFCSNNTDTPDASNPINFTIENSTISGNSTAGANSGGGGVFGLVVTLVVQNSTIANNTALGSGSIGGGIQSSYAGVSNKISAIASTTVSNSTITGNHASQVGGASLSYDVFTITSSIIAGNSDSGADPDFQLVNPGIFPTSGTMNANLIGNNTGTTLTATGSTPDSNGNIIGSGASPINPLLAPLGNHGGPTQTTALLPGSPAIDHGANPASLTTDQRGDPRVVGTAPDIGAFESSGFTLTYVSGSDQTAATSTAFANPLVVQVSSTNPQEPVAGGVVTFAAPISGASTAPSTTTATIAANGQASDTVTANGVVGFYTVTASASGVTGTASFNLGNGTDSQLAGSLIAYIQHLIATGQIGNGTGTSLINAYLKKVTDTTGISDLNSFISAVQKDVQQGKIPPAIGTILIDAALLIETGLTS